MYQIEQHEVFTLEVEQRIFKQLRSAELHQWERLFELGIVQGDAVEWLALDKDRKLILKHISDVDDVELDKFTEEVAQTRDLIIRTFVKMVIGRANRFFSHFLEPGDLVQEGVLGMMKAINRYDLSKGFRFSTYANHWIDAYIARKIKNTETVVRVPWRQQSVGKKLQVYSLDTEVVQLDAVKAARVEPDDCIMLDWEKAEKALRGLPVRSRQILENRFGNEDATLKSIGDTLGISRERIRQIQNKSLAYVRDELQVGEV